MVVPDNIFPERTLVVKCTLIGVVAGLLVGLFTNVVFDVNIYLSAVIAGAVVGWGISYDPLVKYVRSKVGRSNRK